MTDSKLFIPSEKWETFPEPHKKYLSDNEIELCRSYFGSKCYLAMPPSNVLIERIYFTLMPDFIGIEFGELVKFLHRYNIVPFEHHILRQAGKGHQFAVEAIAMGEMIFGKDYDLHQKEACINNGTAL